MITSMNTLSQSTLVKLKFSSLWNSFVLTSSWYNLPLNYSPYKIFFFFWYQCKCLLNAWYCLGRMDYNNRNIYAWLSTNFSNESFPMSQLFAWGGQSTGVSALASFLPKKSQGWSPAKSRTQLSNWTELNWSTNFKQSEWASGQPSSSLYAMLC